MLPRKDDDGRFYVSYSQLSLFKRSPGDYYHRYIHEAPPVTNEYSDFGNKVGGALEENNFNFFSENEKEILKKVPRLDHFERKVELNFKNFFVKGFIDTCDSHYTEIIDYKTGKEGNEEVYKNKSYTQLQIYAMALKQELGYLPLTAKVVFITRTDDFKVADKPPIEIEIDISKDRLREVYFETLDTTRKIAEFYKKYPKPLKNT